MKKQPYTLTEQESAFAAEHHNLIYKYLNEKDLPEDEYYDVVAFGYLNGVVKHFRRDDLKKYAFTTLAWRAMDSCYANHIAKMRRSLPTVSLEEKLNSAYTLEETIADAKNMAEKLISKMTMEETLAGFEATERRIAELLLEGYPKAEIRKQLGLSVSEFAEKLTLMQTAVHHSPLAQAA